MVQLQTMFDIKFVTDRSLGTNINVTDILKYIFVGIIYDVIVEPPSIGHTTDERGNSKPVSDTIIIC